MSAGKDTREEKKLDVKEVRNEMENENLQRE